MGVVVVAAAVVLFLIPIYYYCFFEIGLTMTQEGIVVDGRSWPLVVAVLCCCSFPS